MRPTIPKLQYRLAAATIAACSAVLFSAPGFAHTDDGLSAPAGPDGSNVTFGSGGGQFPFALGSYNGLVLEDSTDEGVDASLDPIRRARRAVSSLGNNQYQKSDIKLGETQKWYFPKDAKNRDGDGDGPQDDKDREGDDGPKEDKDREGDEPKEERPSHRKRANTVYVSMTICSKPRLSKRDTAHDDDPPALPQLEVSILGLDGPDTQSDGWAVFKSEGGYMSAVGDATGDVQLKVTAPESKDYEGTYHYQIAASVDALFHTVDDNPSASLFFVDSDTTTALLTTDHLNETAPGVAPRSLGEALKMRPPFVMFANNVNDQSIEGMERSYCALNQHAQVRGKKSIEASMTTRPGNQTPREQFYVTELNRSSEYTGILAMMGNSTDSGNGIVGGGGRVWQPKKFSTKKEDNCALIHDLDFCTEVAYSVPTNPKTYNNKDKNKLNDLRTLYDDHARTLYKNFTYSLAQIQCNATNNETKWSLTVNCDDCAKAYREWLCAVTIPRCADFTNTNNTALHPRNIMQHFPNGTTLPPTSINKTIRETPAARYGRNHPLNEKIKPGPYKEMLPCRDTCWNLVRSCPSALEFSCPEEPGIWASYGARDDHEDRCNHPEAPFRNSNGGVALRGGVGIGLGVLFWGAVYFELL